MKTRTSKALLDSDFLVALLRQGDFSHRRAKKIIKEEWFGESYLMITSLTKIEAATVMSYRRGMVYARKMLEFVDGLVDEEVFIDKNLMAKGWLIFLGQNKKGSSFNDSMNLVVARASSCERILSFDKFYPKELRVK